MVITNFMESLAQLTNLIFTSYLVSLRNYTNNYNTILNK